MLGQVTNQALMWKLIAGILGVIIPITILIIWKKKTKSGWKPAIVGAIIFVVFSQILEGIPKVIFYTGDTSIANYVWSHPWAYVLIGCLLAGIFEEVGRYVGFRFFLKKYQNKKDAITYGIGHGGLESILILGITGISSVGMAAAINNGDIAQSLSTLSAAQMKSVESQIATLVGYSLSRCFIEVFERLLAITFHLALSIIVFKAVQEKKTVFLFMAIFIHAVFDIPAALYQCGVIGIVFAEIWLLISVILVVLFVRSIYKKM